MSRPKSRTPSRTLATVVMIVGPPSAPNTSQSLSPLRAMVGVIAESGRLFGPTALGEHEAAAAEIARLGQHHRKCEAGGDGGIHRVAAGAQAVNPGLRGELLL